MVMVNSLSYLRYSYHVTERIILICVVVAVLHIFISGILTIFRVIMGLTFHIKIGMRSIKYLGSFVS